MTGTSFPYYALVFSLPISPEAMSLVLSASTDIPIAHQLPNHLLVMFEQL